MQETALTNDKAWSDMWAPNLENPLGLLADPIGVHAAGLKLLNGDVAPNVNWISRNDINPEVAGTTLQASALEPTLFIQGDHINGVDALGLGHFDPAVPADSHAKPIIGILAPDCYPQYEHSHPAPEPIVDEGENNRSDEVNRGARNHVMPLDDTQIEFLADPSWIHLPAVDVDEWHHQTIIDHALPVQPSSKAPQRQLIQPKDVTMRQSCLAEILTKPRR